MQRRDLWVARILRETAGGGNRLLGLDGEAIGLHVCDLSGFFYGLLGMPRNGDLASAARTSARLGGREFG